MYYSIIHYGISLFCDPTWLQYNILLRFLENHNFQVRTLAGEIWIDMIHWHNMILQLYGRSGYRRFKNVVSALHPSPFMTWKFDDLGNLPKGHPWRSSAWLVGQVRFLVEMNFRKTGGTGQTKAAVFAATRNGWQSNVVSVNGKKHTSYFSGL